MKNTLLCCTALALAALFALGAAPALARGGPPAIPEGALYLQEAVLPRGQKLPVYSGPGEAYARAAGGKASVSTNGWVQVFGLEGDWLLIQYGIDEGRMRFGYVPAGDIADEAGELYDLTQAWQQEDYTLPVDAALTDDPLGSRTAVALLPGGSGVVLLGRMGMWMYVETSLDGSRIRGFVPVRALRGIPARDESRPFDLRAVSWGQIGQDEATARYAQRVAGANVWLRLDSAEHPADLEDLSDFRVVAGRAACAPMPVPLSVGDYALNDWLTVHFRPWQGESRGALPIALQPGESLQGVVIACTRTRADGTQETITLPLAGVPMDPGMPDGAVSLSMQRYTPFERTVEQTAAFDHISDNPFTFGGLLEDAFQAMPGAPADVLALPLDAPGYRLWVLEGVMIKAPGPFGAYDVTFALENPPPGVWLAAWQADDAYGELDGFDMIAGGVILPDGLSRDYADAQMWLKETTSGRIALLLLVQGREDADMDALLKTLAIRASFSAEKWNISYEQGGLTTAIGPRSAAMADMQPIMRGEGVLRDIP